jgi:transcriptional regulator with XRE-family HTH domain
MKKEFRYGKKIKEMREARAWTQEQLAEATAVETRTVQRVEKDLTKSPETLQAIAGAFDVDLAKLRSTWLIPQSRLVGTYFADSHGRFVNIEERHRRHAYSRSIVAPMTKEGLKHVDDLLDQILADRNLIEPDETQLWKCYVEQIQEPLASLFDLKLAIFILDECRDLILRDNGFLKPEKPYIDDWRIQYFLVVPRHGCFQKNPSAPLHGFNENCKEGGEAIFEGIKQENVGLHIFSNALVAISGVTKWCDQCFPVRSDGSRLNFEYLELVTGLERAQLYELYEAAAGEEFLQGLA